ncbi:hypothetical protein C1878_08000 [Gordonibacter sp. 28C]|uniref:hypothetical protein n=1 Tax=Gordonibacter sp. 28C TaxID=2078569 RepID=UPI000DF7FE7B|nr:hypothetical protein [Gordonibacter sp. 28C]RDB62264.1 hypothetical protein C1878_08000 [Gordonibacter sp. 28C]
MVEASDVESILRQNLMDAGCAPELVSQCMSQVRACNVSSAHRLLEGHRSALLDELHQAQRKIDCLDYLLHELNKKEE